MVAHLFLGKFVLNIYSSLMSTVLNGPARMVWQPCLLAHHLHFESRVYTFGLQKTYFFCGGLEKFNE